MTFGIIGYGRFGRLWAKHLSRLGRVLVYDSNPNLSIKGKNISRASLRQAARADILFLLVPISEIENCCRQIKNNLLPHTLIADACSVKMYPARTMKESLPNGQPIIATHPLFGPDSAGKAKTFSGFKIAVAPIRVNKNQLREFEAVLKALKLKIYRTTAENHDRQMANSQGLIHFLGRGLSNLKLKSQEIATPDYLSLLNIRDMVVHDTWQLFLDMQRYNKFVKPVRQKFLFNLMRLAAVIDPKKANLGNIRVQIDHLDEVLIKTLAQRISLAQKVGKLKRREGLKVTDSFREKQLTVFHKKISQREKLDYGKVEKIFEVIVNYSKKVQ